MAAIMPKDYAAPPRPPKMPPELSKAIVTVMKGVHAIAKDKENAQGGYKYTSVDQFYEEVRAPMANAGLFTLAHEESVVTATRETTDRYGGKKSSNWSTYVFHLWLYHDSGAEYGPVRREITVVASGPQSAAAAESFVTKYFLRNLFKIATGDMEVDAIQQETGESRWSGKAGAEAATRRKIEACEYTGEAIAALRKITTADALRKWWKDEKPTMEEYFSTNTDPLYVEILDAYKAHGATLSTKPNGDEAPKTEAEPEQKTAGEKLTDDNIPY